jgi:hypothetical protein
MSYNNSTYIGIRKQVTQHLYKYFLLKCSLYERLRNDLFVSLSSHLNINNLLFGDSNLPDCENESNCIEVRWDRIYCVVQKQFHGID